MSLGTRSRSREIASNRVNQTFDDIACTACGCVCDDLQIQVQDNFVSLEGPECELARRWYHQQNLVLHPAAAIDGGQVELQVALHRTIELLKSADNPLIYGLSRSSTAGQREAIRLADFIGANIDTTASTCHAPSIMAIQMVGESTGTLGEVRHRADLVIYWGVDPIESHPRHMERYAVDPIGLFTPHGRGSRTLVVVDSRHTNVARQADLFIPVRADQQFEVITALRCLLRGEDLVGCEKLGADRASLDQLVELMKSCRCGVVFFGLRLVQEPLGHLHAAALLKLVAELNSHSHFYARRMRIPGDVTGADTVLCWQTGYPFSVNLARGYPRYNPGEFSAEELLERREVDSCLFVGSEGIREFSADAIAALDSIPTIVLDHAFAEPAIAPSVWITTAVYGVDLPGCAYRMDEVPIRLRQVRSSPYPSDDAILAEICGGICEQQANRGPRTRLDSPSRE